MEEQKIVRLTEKSMTKPRHELEVKLQIGNQPGFDKMRTRSILGLREATASAKHPPNESPTK